MRWAARPEKIYGYRYSKNMERIWVYFVRRKLFKNVDNEIKITFKVVIAKHIKWMQHFIEALHEL